MLFTWEIDTRNSTKRRNWISYKFTSRLLLHAKVSDRTFLFLFQSCQLISCTEPMPIFFQSINLSFNSIKRQFLHWLNHNNQGNGSMPTILLNVRCHLKRPSAMCLRKSALENRHGYQITMRQTSDRKFEILRFPLLVFIDSHTENIDITFQ